MTSGSKSGEGLSASFRLLGVLSEESNIPFCIDDRTLVSFQISLDLLEILTVYTAAVLPSSIFHLTKRSSLLRSTWEEWRRASVERRKVSSMGVAVEKKLRCSRRKKAAQKLNII